MGPELLDATFGLEAVSQFVSDAAEGSMRYFKELGVNLSAPLAGILEAYLSGKFTRGLQTSRFPADGRRDFTSQVADAKGYCSCSSCI